jgi:aubergine-like protein
MSTSVDNYQELARKDLINKLVLTRYDNRTQRIDNIDFQLTPATFTCNEDSKMTLMDYYLNKFDITIKDPDQPLIVYCPRRPGENPVRIK